MHHEEKEVAILVLPPTLARFNGLLRAYGYSPDRMVDQLIDDQHELRRHRMAAHLRYMEAAR